MPEPEVITEKSYSEKEWKGLLGDKQNETRARQEAQAEAVIYKTQLADLQAQLAKKEAVDTRDPEDVVTVAMLKKEIADLKSLYTKTETEKEAKQTKAEQEKAKAKREKLLEKSLKDAREKYTKEKVGKGLSFDEVSEGTTRMVEKNKVYGELIFNDSDPAEKAYEVGLLDPVIAKRYETYKKTLPPEPPANKDGLTGTTVPGGFYSQEYVKKMQGTGWIKEHLAEIRESQKKWTK